MSMIGNYRRVSEDQLAALRADPSQVSAFLYENPAPPGMHTFIDKTWHAIHFLLNGDTWAGTPPLFDAVLGGEVLGTKDVGYGPPRYLTATEVKLVADALDHVPAFELIRRYDAQALNDADIYPQGWRDNAADRGYIEGHYLRLAQFFRAAADANDAMLLYLD